MEEEDGIRPDILTDTVVKAGEPLHSADATCVICLQPITEQALCRPCRHANFDFLCLVSWLHERSACPLCKTGVTIVDYGWLSPQGRRSYVVPQRASQKDDVPLTGNEPSSYSDPHTRPTRRYPRPRRPARPSRPPLSPDDALLRRRHVYAQKLYSLHVGTNRLSRFRDLSPQLFSRDEELMRRARKWIRRELQVFDFLNIQGQDEEEGIMRRTNNSEFLLEYIVAILKTVDVKGSGGQAEDMLQEFLGRENTQLFLHELKAWLRSPYTSLEDWDRHVQYADTHAQSSGRAKFPPSGFGRDSNGQPQADSNGTPRIPPFSYGVERRYHDRYTPYPERSQPWRR